MSASGVRASRAGANITPIPDLYSHRAGITAGWCGDLGERVARVVGVIVHRSLLRVRIGAPEGANARLLPTEDRFLGGTRSRGEPRKQRPEPRQRTVGRR